METVDTIHMTRAEFEREQALLEELEGPKRREIADAIAHARGFGDLSENAEYHAARDEQAHLEARIAKLREKLERVEIVEAVGRKADVGSIVELEDEAGERFKVRVSNVVGQSDGLQNVSPQSPIGRAIMGASAGQEVEVKAPRGSWRATVKSVRADKSR